MRTWCKPPQINHHHHHQHQIWSQQPLTTQQSLRQDPGPPTRPICSINFSIPSTPAVQPLNKASTSSPFSSPPSYSTSSTTATSNRNRGRSKSKYTAPFLRTPPPPPPPQKNNFSKTIANPANGLPPLTSSPPRLPTRTGTCTRPNRSPTAPSATGPSTTPPWVCVPCNRKTG